MKDSGIEWIGEIPESWTFIKGKFLFTERNERGNKNTLQLLSPTQKYGVIPQSLYEELSGMKAVKLDEKTDYNTMKSIYNGDFCISLRSFQGGFEYSEYDGVVSPAYHVFYKTEDLCNAYYRYLFKEQGFISKMASLTKTFRDGKSIAFTDFADSLIPVPPLPEQQAISAYLDRQCGLIDSVIEKTKASVEEYKKLRQAVITQAVTKGVRGDRQMKDSGIEWIGEIPEGWQILKSWYTMDTLGDIDHFMPESTDNGKPYLMIGDLKDNSSEIVFDKCKKISDEDFDNLSVKFKPMNGDVIFARYATIGTVCYVDTDNDFLVSYACVTIRPNQKNMTGKFMYYYFKSSIFIEDIRKFINSNTQGNVGKDSLTKFHMIVPSMYEQKEIAEYLDKKCTEIDTLITKKEQFLTELESYKKSMIYEYVTGKKEVPQS